MAATAAVRALATARADLEDVLRRPPSMSEPADEVEPPPLRDLAQKDSAWDGLDEAGVAAAQPLLFGPGGLLELAQRGSADKAPALVACRRHALDACGRFLEHLPGLGAPPLATDRLKAVAIGCLQVFKHDVANQVGASALQLLLRALEVSAGTVNVVLEARGLGRTLGDELLKELKVRHTKLTAGQLSLLLRALATLADREAAASGAPLEALAAELRARLLGTLEREVDSKKPTLELVAGTLEATSTLLARHSGFFSRVELRKVFDTAYVIALTDDAQAGRLAPQRAALQMLRRHAGLFHEFWVEDAVALVDPGSVKEEDLPGEIAAGNAGRLLKRLLRVTEAPQADVAAAGRSTLDAVLRALSDSVANAASPPAPVDADVLMADAEEGRVPKRAMDPAGGGEALQGREAALVQAWYPHFREMVLSAQGAERAAAAVSGKALIGARSLGALAPAVARLEGAAVVLDLLETILDVAEVAITAPDVRATEVDEADGAVGPGRVAGALPDYAEALARAVPPVRPWLTSAQWARVLGVGVHLLKGFARGFTKHRPKFALACVSLLAAFDAPASEVPAVAASQGSSLGSGSGVAPYETFVAHGVVLMVTEEPALQALWELVLIHLEREGAREAEQHLVGSLVDAVLSMARQGVENHLRLLRHEERGNRKVADHVARARAKAKGGLSMRFGSLAPLSPTQDLHQVVAEADPGFALQAAYVYEQAVQTTGFLQRVAEFLDRIFSGAKASERSQLVAPLADAILATVIELVSLCRGVGAPPPGVFKLLQVAFACSTRTDRQGDAGRLPRGKGLDRLLPGFLQDVAGALEGFQGAVASEALEALLSVDPQWVHPREWLPVFRRALAEGLQDMGLAQHALRQLEHWRDAGAEFDWKALLPGLAAHLVSHGPAEAGAKAGAGSAAERRASSAVTTKRLEDRGTFLRRLLRFVGSLGGDCHALVVAEPPPEELQRPLAALSVHMSVMLGDQEVELDPALLLPHLARLLKRGQRRTARLAAAEALHALLRLVIGSDSMKAAEGASSGGQDFAEAMRAPLLPMALKAAADEDPTIAHLFRTLVAQFVNWIVRNPPVTAMRSSLRDALLEAMRDPHSPGLRATASRYYAEFMRGLRAKSTQDEVHAVRRLLQHLFAAASHVDRRTQLGALQALLWYSLAWDGDPAAVKDAADCMQVVVLALQTAHLDGPEGLPKEALALQLGGRLLRPLAQAAAGAGVAAAAAGATGQRVQLPGELAVRLWRGAGLLEPAARGFCRDALRALRPAALDAASASREAQAASAEPLPWPRLALAPPPAQAPPEAAAVARALELATARLDTALWLAADRGGARALLGGGGGTAALGPLPGLEDERLARRLAEEESVLVPWAPEGGIGEDRLAEALARYPAKERDRINLARARTLVVLVSYAKLGPSPPSGRTVELLVTIILEPAALLVSGHALWGSAAARRRVLRAAAEAVRRAFPSAGTGRDPSVAAFFSRWLQLHPNADLARCSGVAGGGAGSGGAFEALLRRWPEHRRGDLLGAAQRLAAYADGLDVLRQEVFTEAGAIWRVFFSGWSGGFEAMVRDWQQSASFHSQKRGVASSQIITQALVRILLVALPPELDAPPPGPSPTVSLSLARLPSAASAPNSGTSAADAGAGASAAEGAVMSALLTLPRPPPEAALQLLHFLASRAPRVLELSRPWGARAKRALLSWLCDLAALAADGGASAGGTPGTQEAELSARGGKDAGDVDEPHALSSQGPALHGSVLDSPGAAAATQPTPPGAHPGAAVAAAEAVAQLVAELPRWHEWAVSEVAHGGVEAAEEAPPDPPPAAKRRRKETGVTTALERAQKARADRTGLYQLAALLHACANLEPVLRALASGDPGLCHLLPVVLGAALKSDMCAPRTKALLLVAVPPLLLRAEVRAGAALAPKALRDAVAAVVDSVKEMVLQYFPLHSKEYKRDAEEYNAYLALLDGLFRALELSAPSMRLLPALHATLRERAHREEPRLRGFVARFVRHLLAAPAAAAAAAAAGRGAAAAASFASLLDLFLDETLDDRIEENVRFALMEKLALPLLWELTGTTDGCEAVWVEHWPRLLTLADPRQSFANIRVHDAQALLLKVQEMACVYGAIEILFIRTPPEVLRERISQRLASSPTRDFIPVARKALEPPPGHDRLDARSLRRCNLRIYAAWSAAVCATQAKQDLYISWLFKEDLWSGDLLIEPWASRPVDLSALNPSTNFSTFPRPGYSLSFLAAPSAGRRAAGLARRGGLPDSLGGPDATLLGAGLWAATQGLGSLPGTLGALGAVGDASQRANALQRAAAGRAAGTLSLALPVTQRRRFAETVARTQGAAASLEVISETWGGELPGQVDGAGQRLQAALAGWRPRPPAEGEEAEPADGAAPPAVWYTEWLEHDVHLFPDSPAQDLGLALLLVWLRTVDVMTERFGVDAPEGPGWLSPLLRAAESPMANFRVRLLVLRVLVLRAEMLRPLLYGRNARVFRFVVGIMLDPDFGAQKRFHYLFRDALQRLVVPEFIADEENGQAGGATAGGVPAPECAYEAQRLLHHVQMLAPHRITYWQRVHIALVRLYTMHFVAQAGHMPIEPDRSRLVQQLTAKNPEIALILQQSALRQLAIFLEYGSFDPFRVGPEGPTEAQWRDGLMLCVTSRDTQVAAFACGVIGLVAKWHPIQGRALVDECCTRIEVPVDGKTTQEKADGFRMALCAEQLLTQCPWVLSDPEFPGGAGGSSRRRLFARMISRLPSAFTMVLKPLLSAFLSMCRDCLQEDDPALGAAAGGAGAAAAPRRRPPPRPTGDAARALRRERLGEVILAMRTGDVWRRGLLSKDAATQRACAGLARAVASELDDETLLGVAGLMLEADAALRESSSREALDRRTTFTQELLAVCITICSRRPDVARAEVAGEKILAFMVHSAISEDEALREKALAFWEAQLSAQAAPRLRELCTRLCAAEVETIFIPATLQLLLTLARRSPEFRRKLVKRPLEPDFEFRPMRVVSSSWAAGSQSVATFQLGASWGSVFRSTLTQKAPRFWRGQEGGSFAAPVGSVAASLAHEAIPAQLKAYRPARTAASGGGPAGATQAPMLAPQGPPSGLVRHSETDAKFSAIAATERQTKAALASLERREREGSEADAPVKLVRGYRVGDFPDVEVSAEDIMEPLARAALGDAALGEELLLSLWLGVAARTDGGGAAAARPDGEAAAQQLEQAMTTIFEHCRRDEGLVHFLHNLVMRSGRHRCAMLPVQAVQRTMDASVLSGVQALEELLPPLGGGGPPAAAPGAAAAVPRGAPIEDKGRHRSLLSAIYGGCADLGEQPSMDAAAQQLAAIQAFTSQQCALAFAALRERRTAVAEDMLGRVLDQREAALPIWELQMARSAWLNALEEMMSWDRLQGALKDTSDGSGAVNPVDPRSLRAELGRSIMPLAGADPAGALDAHLAATGAARQRGARSAMLLATHAARKQRWEDARRLVFEGYDSFLSAWRRAPLLATRARHEMLSSLPLLRAVEAFVEEATGKRPAAASGPRPLSAEHDRLMAWVDSGLVKLVAARAKADKQAEASAYAELGRRSCAAGNLKGASDLLAYCLKSRVRQDYKFFEDVIEVKLQDVRVPCGKLCDTVQMEAAKHKDPENAIHYYLILGKVARAGWERREMDHWRAWRAHEDARNLSVTCGEDLQSGACAKLAEFADMILRRADGTTGEPQEDRLDAAAKEQIVKALVECVLRTLQLGAAAAAPRTQSGSFSQAHDRLPRLFELLAAHPQCTPLFQEKVVGVPPWVLLRWLPQALAHLPSVPALMQPLLALGRQFPQALVWPLQLCSHADVVGGRAELFRPLWTALETTSAPIATARRMTQALHGLTHPNMRFDMEFSKFMACRCFSGKEAPLPGSLAEAKERWQVLWQKVLDLSGDDALLGRVHREFAEIVKQELRRIAEQLGTPSFAGPVLADADILQVRPKGVLHHIRESVGKIRSTAATALQDYSPFLHDFDARSSWLGSMEEQLEVPGQYRGLERPDPRSHVKILRFQPTLLIMVSKQKPKRLQVLGSDEKEHWFLVKSGEDVRLDERVEQLFSAINGLVATEASLGLRVRTYSVVPLLPDLGVLEWVRDTKPLKGLVVDLSKARDPRIKDFKDVDAHRQRVEWASKYKGKGVPQRYEEIFRQRREDIEVAFKRFSRSLPEEATLKAFFQQRALGPEALWHTRQRFAASLAASSAAGYILGIGDRHLDNSLMCLSTGEIVPIDFGYSFGIGAHLPVPEMVPFRLTGFLLSALQPLAGPKANGAFRDGLERVMRRCRESRGLLQDACDVFIREPLVDWAADAKRRAKDTGEALDFLPRHRLGALAGRLRGRHPAAVLMEDLRHTQCLWVRRRLEEDSKKPADSPDRLEAIAAGLHEEARARLYRKEDVLTVPEQVECLIQMATDPNILGRAWEGWAPEI